MEKLKTKPIREEGKYMQSKLKIWKERIKSALSGLRQFLAIEGSFKMMKNAFYFTLKALFVITIFKFLF